MPLVTLLTPSENSGGVFATDDDVVALPVRPGADGPELALTATGPDVAAVLDGLPAPWPKLLEYHRATGEAGEAGESPAAYGDGLLRVLFLGIGDGGPEALRKAGAVAARRAKGRGTLTAVLGESAGEEGQTAFAEGALLGSYTFTMASTDSKPAPVRRIALPGARAEALERGQAYARAVADARDLINTPSAEKGPAWIADRAAEVAAESGLSIQVRDEERLAAEGFGGLIAVGMGSPRPPRLIELDYRPDGEPVAHVVLAGKGITFDTGGLSLKPNDNMKLMKTDMSGAAIVLSVMSALAGLGVRARVTGLLATAENSISGSAQRPGDVITQYGGTTVEVLNTDAEGRLVLADALAYADRHLDPDVMVDIATLTGAARVALGSAYGALFSTSDPLAAALTEAGAGTGERVWRMPLTAEYRDGLDSPVADLANIAKAKYGRPGAIEAALFLREFTGSRPWAHLDISGPGRSTADEGVLTKGGTGFGTRLLLNWLRSL
ncbi:MAG: leucyl aminopeptidase [Streptosporangiales bacterium]|nr:leucyl aminopeptidase [Streptosporangiales bacterium]